MLKQDRQEVRATAGRAASWYSLAPPASGIPQIYWAGGQITPEFSHHQESAGARDGTLLVEGGGGQEKEGGRALWH